MYTEQDQIFLIPEQSIQDIAKGGFARRVFVASLSEPAFPAHTGFLEKILAAAGLNLEKDTLFAEIPEQKPFSFLSVIREKQAERVLVFGVPPKQLGLQTNTRLYQPFSFYGVSFLFADALSVLAQNKTLKSQLWQALQLMFLQ
ncbi:MAG: hypothetical protein EP344_13050 [Bacteroidetes bacterium]|nr:MAG: hypothetical protein EP344_13050 [Bacteroidota bacterium]